MKIIIERPKCIGCGSCEAVCEKIFSLGSDGLVSFQKNLADEGSVSLEINEIGCAQEAVDVCAVQAIKIES
ncbi:MAG: ferredoxin [Patescibacteria group bacterium]